MDIGFQALLFFTRENVSATAIVCAQIDRGSLEREVEVYLSTIPGGTAIGKYSLVPRSYSQLSMLKLGVGSWNEARVS